METTENYCIKMSQKYFSSEVKCHQGNEILDKRFLALLFENGNDFHMKCASNDGIFDGADAFKYMYRLHNFWADQQKIVLVQALMFTINSSYYLLMISAFFLFVKQ